MFEKMAESLYQGMAKWIQYKLFSFVSPLQRHLEQAGHGVDHPFPATVMWLLMSLMLGPDLHFDMLPMLELLLQEFPLICSHHLASGPVSFYGSPLASQMPA